MPLPQDLPLWVQLVPITAFVIYIVYSFLDDYSGFRRSFGDEDFAPDEEILHMLVEAWRLSGLPYQRSYDLLVQSLSPAQKHSFEKRGWFEAVGSHSKKIYKISAASSVNVFHDGRLYCAEAYTVPIFDKILTQKLMIEFDEKKFKKIANKF